MALDFDGTPGPGDWQVPRLPTPKSDARRPRSIMPRSGPKAMLQRKLHAALVLAAQPEAMDT